MQATSPPTDVFHFGVFQLDLKTGELHKAGIRVKLQDQPFRVLALLVSRAGQVVTREELRQRVWPSNV
jgi:DNA-binding winged helix-turn-helix (wHTH) protein